jgi:hypothetical protein
MKIVELGTEEAAIATVLGVAISRLLTMSLANPELQGLSAFVSTNEPLLRMLINTEAERVVALNCIFGVGVALEAPTVINPETWSMEIAAIAGMASAASNADNRSAAMAHLRQIGQIAAAAFSLCAPADDKPRQQGATT